MRIGLSLSFCIKDILDGKVREDEVLAIITGTNAQNAVEREKLLNGYCETYWRGQEKEALMVVDRLNGRIMQPRRFGIEVPATYRGHWIEFNNDQSGVMLTR